MLKIEVEFKKDNQFNNYKLLLLNQAEKIVEQIKQEFKHQGIKSEVTYTVQDDGIELHFTVNNEPIKKIPIKVVNGRLIVPDEYKQFLSEDGKSLDMKQNGKIEKILNNIDLRL
jgi:hypothetical protein